MRRLFRSGLVLALVAALVVLWGSGLPGTAGLWLLARAHGADWEGPRLGLAGYRAEVQHRAIEGLSRNVSGLTWSHATGTLFTVVNDPPEAAELSRDGVLLRRIPIVNGIDTEGITHVGGDTFVIADEGGHSLHWVTIGPDTRSVTLGEGPSLRLQLGMRRNMGFEGVSWDAGAGRLYIVQEMRPLRVLTIDGVEAAISRQGMALDIAEWRGPGLMGLLKLDLSSVSLHEGTGTLLLLSHMSALVVEYAPDGTPIGLLPLRRGMRGLSRTIRQAEGIAVGPEGEIFIVSEPNLFYRFARRGAAL